ncbi:MAG: sugar transferase, partial [Candidatus Sumerlaeota bacterium]|nr:sugar transferase [Candidatus Sumerlaeota bacterium]
RETRCLYQQLSLLADLLLCLAAFFLAHAIRNYLLVPVTHGWIVPSTMRYYLPLAILFPPLALLMWHANGAYRLERLFDRGAMARSLILGAIEAAGVLILIRFFFSAPQKDPYSGAMIRDSRGQMLLFPMIATAVVWARVEAAYAWFRWRRQRGRAARNVLLVGSGDNLRRFIADLMTHPFWGIRIEGLVSDHDSLSVGERIQGHPVVASIASLAAYLEKHVVDEVIFVPGKTPLDDLSPCLRECETMGVRTRLSLNFFMRGVRGASLDTFEDIPVVTYDAVQEVNGALLVKWAFDRAASALALLFLSLPMLVIALIIRRDGPAGAPVLFRQRRVGRNGREFILYKFRTMRPGAEEELESLRARSEVDGPRFKMANDPRVTRVGRRLRKYSLDELPQLWNVLRGDMSLVGPRPPLPEEVARYIRSQRRRLSMKPGITCLWAVRGRDRLSWDQWMQADLEYIDRWSLWLDFKILVKTFLIVLQGKNAS